MSSKVTHYGRMYASGSNGIPVLPAKFPLIVGGEMVFDRLEVQSMGVYH